MRGTILLSHGSDASPEATKVSALAVLAEARGWRTQRPDYRQDDAHGHAGSVAPRLARLNAAIAACEAPPVLVGSSMGAFVSALASLEHPVAGLFLLATPSAIPGVDSELDLRQDVPTLLVHGWRDEVCPIDGIERFSSRYRLPLLALDDDHRLSNSLPAIERQFALFLDALA
ncbi:MAG TPA: alpha/beta fold hydrolase [Frateuria sp.]|uniref:alpha/beta hydrolase n=1 Tax=Frateuria sp. TaxID=2211372 RepID=UPI002D80F113|nr:alpha/beta fold hydrolase [Frateuria sp.]HET6803884.1 alpha/beta fold hydrolase [Frateuria sp.]